LSQVLKDKLEKKRIPVSHSGFQKGTSHCFRSHWN